MALKGACLCGGIRYEVEAEPAVVGHCHCTRCQRKGGGGSITGVLVPHEAIDLTSGEDLLRTFSEEGFTSRHFCSACGSQIYGSTADFAVIVAGTLEPGTRLEPQFHMMVDFKAPWDEIHDDLPQFGEYPPSS